MTLGTTSAGALHDILFAVHQHKPPNERFLTALTKVMDQTGRDGEITALSRLLMLFKKVHEDIEALPLDATLKKQAKIAIQKFAGIENLTHFTMEVSKVNTNVIKKDHLEGLKWLHMAMVGRFGDPYDQSEIGDLADKLRELRSELPDVGLSREVARVIDKRLGQIIEILTRYGGYGADDLASETKALVGEIFVEGLKAEGRSWEYLKRLGALAAICIGVAQGGNEAMQLGLELHDNSKKIIELFNEEVPLLEGPKTGVAQVDHVEAPRSPETGDDKESE